MRRREFLKAAALLPIATAYGCATPFSPVPIFSSAIDAHCHVFNASDLPAARFIRYVFLEKYPETETVRLLDIRDPDLVDRLIELFLAILGANRAPSASDEIDVLDGREAAHAANKSEEAASKIAVAATSDYLLSIQSARVKRSKSTRISRSQDQILAAFLEAAGGRANLQEAEITTSSANEIASKAFASLADLGVYLRWFNLFTLYRHVLVDRLTSDTKKQGLSPVLLAPATVDYDRWLREDVKRSPLIDQISVMGRISRRKIGPSVHGYFGFDPLREVYYRGRVAGERQSPLILARKALVEHGFIGVKLYPPMGFRPSGNTGDYPKEILKEVGNPSRRLDDALADLYTLCVELDAPILAHGYGSNGANKYFERRADPAYWLPVFAKHPELGVCLGHFGRFDLVSAASSSLRFPEASWEWALGGHIKRNPHSRVVADISYFSEVLSSDRKLRSRIAGFFKDYVAEFDPNVEHLLYGTDWLMLGLEAGYMRYAQSVHDFLKVDCGLDDEALYRVFRGNAIRYMGLQNNGRARKRLLNFYLTHGLPEGRLPSS